MGLVQIVISRERVRAGKKKKSPPNPQMDISFATNYNSLPKINYY